MTPFEWAYQVLSTQGTHLHLSFILSIFLLIKKVARSINCFSYKIKNYCVFTAGMVIGDFFQKIMKSLCSNDYLVSVHSCLPEKTDHWYQKEH